MKLPDDPSPVPAGISDMGRDFQLRRSQILHQERFANQRMVDLGSLRHYAPCPSI